MEAGWSILARRLAGNVAAAALAQAAVLWVVLWPAHGHFVLLVVLEVIAGTLVALAVAGWPGVMTGGWPGAMAGTLIGGTAVATADTVLTGGQLGVGLLVALSLALMFFTPGYLLGGAYAADPDMRTGGPTPRARIALAGLIVAADIAIVAWVLDGLRHLGP